MRARLAGRRLRRWCADGTLLAAVERKSLADLVSLADHRQAEVPAHRARRRAARRGGRGGPVLRGLQARARATRPSSPTGSPSARCALAERPDRLLRDPQARPGVDLPVPRRGPGRGGGAVRRRARRRRPGGARAAGARAAVAARRARVGAGAGAGGLGPGPRAGPAGRGLPGGAGQQRSCILCTRAPLSAPAGQAQGTDPSRASPSRSPGTEVDLTGVRRAPSAPSARRRGPARATWATSCSTIASMTCGRFAILPEVKTSVSRAIPPVT